MKEFITFLISLSAIVLYLTSCNNSENPTAGYNDVNGIIVIINGVLIDGTDSDPVPDALIIIKDRNIMSVGRAPRFPVPWCTNNRWKAILSY